MDAYSDLDFFAIVEPDAKDAFMSDLAWLERVHPIAFSFQNTRGGDKVLFTDGIYAEYAVLTPDQLPRLPIHGGRIVWQAEGSALTRWPCAISRQRHRSRIPSNGSRLCAYGLSDES